MARLGCTGICECKFKRPAKENISEVDFDNCKAFYSISCRNKSESYGSPEKKDFRFESAAKPSLTLKRGERSQ